MNRSDLIKALSGRTNLTNYKADEVVDIIFDAMTRALINGERIDIRGFGNFVLKQYEGYLGRNPRTGQRIEVPPKKLPLFKVGKDLKERVDHQVEYKSFLNLPT